LALSEEQIKENLILSIEVVLMRRGGPEFHLVMAKLKNDYDLEIRDCYENVEYLRNILKEVYHDDFESIVEEITWELGEYVHERGIEEFLDALK
jgi:hypothetical protein